MATILLVDDEEIWSGRYATQLRYRGYDVQLCHTVSDAKRCYGELSEIDLLITDLMMPTEGLESKNVFAAGFHLAEDFRATGFTGPIVIFSLLDEDLLEDRIRWEFPDDSKICGFSKTTVDPDGLPDKVDALLGRQRQSQGQTWLRRLLSSLIFQPNFAGLGVDLKKLFRRRN